MAASLPPDFFPPEGDDSIALLRYFYFDTEAQFAALQLRSVGIQCFVSNANSQTILPMGQGWIGLHVFQRDVAPAVAVLRQAGLWDDAQEEASSPTQLSSQQPFGNSFVGWLIIAILLLAILLHFLVKGSAIFS
ncbi:MAG: hypothetical protein R2795_09735 [Saprospiraceae bacterium]